MNKSTRKPRDIKTFITGEVLTNRIGDEFIVIDEFYDRQLHKRLLKVKFLKTNYITDWVAASDVTCKTIKDPYSPIILGIACLGEITEEIRQHPLYHKLYNTWYHMLKRCLDPSDTNYRSYGALGVTVDPRWYNFTVFFYDAQQLPGYERLLNGEDMHLDKDYKQFYLPSNLKRYSRDTCIFLPSLFNSALPGMKKYLGDDFNIQQVMTSTDYEYYNQYFPEPLREMCHIIR